MENTLKIPQIPQDALINIEVSAGFLKRCQTLLLQLLQELGEEKLNITLEKFKTPEKEPENVTDATIFILLALVSEIEKQAVEQKKVVEVSVNPEDFEKEFKSTGN